MLGVYRSTNATIRRAHLHQADRGHGRDGAAGHDRQHRGLRHGDGSGDPNRIVGGGCRARRPPTTAAPTSRPTRWPRRRCSPRRSSPPPAPRAWRASAGNRGGRGHARFYVAKRRDPPTDGCASRPTAVPPGRPFLTGGPELLHGPVLLRHRDRRPPHGREYPEPRAAFAHDLRRSAPPTAASTFTTNAIAHRACTWTAT